jgi:hypothetical protein
MYNGSLNPNNDHLEDERSLELYTDMGLMLIKVVEKKSTGYEVSNYL